MRKMKNVETGEVHVVKQHIILRNLWELYVTDDDGVGNVYGLMLGFENEWGWSSSEELASLIVRSTKKLTDLMPATGYVWV